MADPIGLSKRELRRALIRFVAPGWLVLTTADGAADGSSFIAGGYIGSQTATFQYWWALLDAVDDADPDDAVSEYRNVNTIDQTTGEVTLYQPFSTQIFDNAELELLPIQPDKLTECLNQAMSETYPALHANNVDDSLEVVADQQEYELPEGITPDLITKVMVEGDTPFDGIPYYQVNNVTYSADGLLMYWNRNTSSFDAYTAGRTIYIYYQSYLNALDNDDTYGLVTHDTLEMDEVGVLLTPRTNPWQLYMLFARAILFEMLAGSPGVQNQAQAQATAQRYRQIAEAKKSSLRMEQLESAGYA